MNRSATAAGSDFFALGRVTLLRIFGAALGFAATFFVTVQLGAEQAGLLFGTIAWVFALAIVANWGGSQLLLIDLAPLTASGRSKFAAGLANRIMLSAVARAAVLVVAAGGAFWALLAAGHQVQLIGWLLVALTLATVILQLLAAAGKAIGDPAGPVLCEFAVIPAVVIFVSAVAWFGAGELGATEAGFAYLGGTILAAILIYALVLRQHWHGGASRRPSAARRKRMANFGVTELSAFASAQGAMVVMPLLMPIADVGVFNLALRIVSTVGLPISALLTLVIPRLSRALARRDAAEWGAAIRHGKHAMLAGAILFAVGVGVLGPVLLAWAGPEFAGATVPLLIMTTLFAAGMALGPGSAILSVARQEHIARNVAVAVGFGSLAALVPAILLFGMTGAAVVTGAAYFLQKLLLWYFERRVDPFSAAATPANQP